MPPGSNADTLTARLEQLVQWGNLLRSSHTVKASSISEYQRSRARYQLSKLGEHIQRDGDGVLAEADATREASNELLALVERGLRELAELATAPGAIGDVLHEVPESADGFTPHVSVAYSASDGSAEPVTRALDGLELTPAHARICTAELIVKYRNNQMHEWEHFATAPLG